MSKKDWLKKLDPSKIEDVEFEDITEQKSGSVNETKAEDSISPEIDRWTEKKEEKLKSLTEEITLKTNRLKELEESIRKISPQNGTLEIKSFESSFVDKEFKELINDLFKSNRLGQVYQSSVEGRGDYLIFKLDARTKGIFGSRKKIESEVASREGELIVKNHSLTGNGKSKKTDFFKKEIETFLEKIKTDIQNQETNYIDEIKIEKGILQVKFGLGKETSTPEDKKLEELEQERQALELLLKEKNKSKSLLLDEKWKILNDVSEEEPIKEFSIGETMKIPLIAKIEGRIWRCQNDEDLKNLSESLKNEGTKLNAEEQKTWEDVLPILDLSKEEIIGVLSLWKDWAKNEKNPELKKWSQDCIDILGKVINDISKEEKSNEQILDEEINNIKESQIYTPDESLESSEDETEIINRNKKLDNEEIDEKIKNLDEKSPLYQVQLEALEKERAEINDYYDSRLKKSNKEKSNDNEYIPITYDTENYEMSLISMDGLKDKIEERLKQKLEIRKINLKEIKINTIEKGFNIEISLEEDSSGRKKILGEFEIINEKNGLLVKEIKNENNSKLAEVLIKDIRLEIRKTIDKIIESVEKKESKESKMVRIKGESFEIIFEK